MTDLSKFSAGDEFFVKELNAGATPNSGVCCSVNPVAFLRPITEEEHDILRSGKYNCVICFYRGHLDRHGRSVIDYDQQFYCHSSSLHRTKKEARSGSAADLKHKLYWES